PVAAKVPVQPEAETEAEEITAPAPPIGRREPRLSPRRLAEPELRIEAGARPVPPPTAKRGRSRALSGFTTGAGIALLGVLIYILATQYDRFLPHLSLNA